jgi:hypothetical protein
MAGGKELDREDVLCDVDVNVDVHQRCFPPWFLQNPTLDVDYEFP